MREDHVKRIGAMISVFGLFLFVPVAQAGWTTAKRLTWNSGHSYYPAIAVGPSGQLHIVWQDSAPGNWQIYYKRSTDGGTTWSAARRLTWTSGGSMSPAIAVDPDGRVHMLWNDATSGNDEIYYTKSADGGDTWATKKRLTWTSGGSTNPAIAVDSSGHLHAVWHDNTPANFEIYYKRSTDCGATWTTGKRLTWTLGDSVSPAVVADSSGTIHLVWEDRTPGNYEIYYKKSTDGGTTWTTNKRLTWNAGWSQFPAIQVDSSDRLHVVWDDGTTGNFEIYYKKSSNGGSTWTASRRLSWNSGYSYSPSICVDAAAALHIVWHDNTNGDFELCYKKSTDGGTSWTTVQRITSNSGFSGWAAIASDASANLHVVYYDDTPGNYEIYYKKFIK